MYVVISGGGDVGQVLAHTLIKEGHNVAIIEKDEKTVERLEGLDALIIHGNGASPHKLDEAYVEHANIFVAVTGNDEVNIIGCMLAKEYGCKTIARITNPDYIAEPISTDLSHLGIDIAISPEMISAVRIARILTMPTMFESESFAGGRVRVIDMTVKKDAFISGKSIKKSNLPGNTNIVAIYRDGDIIIPSGKDIFVPGDRVVAVVGNLSVVPDIREMFGYVRSWESEEKQLSKVMVYGATSLGIELVKLLAHEKIQVILIEEDMDRCEEISEIMPPNVLVVNGSGEDKELLFQEGIENVDAFVALTESEEHNVLSSLAAKQYGARKAVALIDRIERKGMVEDIGVDLALTIKLTTVATVMRYLHREEILSMSLLYRGEAQVAEIRVSDESPLLDTPIMKLRIPKGVIIGAIIRAGHVIIPRGKDMIKKGDRLIIFFRTELMKKVEKIFMK